jgi:phosphatidylglycerophosphate synthase
MNNRLVDLWNTKTKNDEWWSSFVTAPLAIAANYFVVDQPWLTPNRITALSFLVAIISVIFIILGGSINFVAAAGLIHFSHVLDCMDGQMARFRQVSSPIGSYYDRLTDQIQVTLWFGAVGYAAYVQSDSVAPVFLALIGIAFYGLRGYVKYVAIEIETARDPGYPAMIARLSIVTPIAGLGFNARANIIWFLKEQRKILDCDEGVFIFILSAALILDQLEPMLWLFAVSQVFWGLYWAVKQGKNIQQNIQKPIHK